MLTKFKRLQADGAGKHGRIGMRIAFKISFQVMQHVGAGNAGSHLVHKPGLPGVNKICDAVLGAEQ